ncbi:MAG: hypothetical protein CMR00_02465 [[Chlorobium] sp. 445]|nr:MAG: hypothetical protein CMR00_02465 [[Chlorobium] sp. 445]
MTKVFRAFLIPFVFGLNLSTLPAQHFPTLSDTSKTASFSRELLPSLLPFIEESARISVELLTEWKKFENAILERATRITEPSLQRFIKRKASEMSASLDSASTAFRAEQYARLQIFQNTLRALAPDSQKIALEKAKLAEFHHIEQFQRDLEAQLKQHTATLSQYIEDLVAISEMGISHTAKARRNATPDESDVLLPDIPTPIGLYFSASFNSQSVWYGLQQNLSTRNDSDIVSAGAMFFSATYTHPIGIWGSVEAVGLFGQSQFFDQFTLSIGAEQTFFEALLVGANYSRYFFSPTSVQFSSIISDNLGTYLTYTNPILTPSVSFNYGFSRTLNSLFLTLSLSRTFSLEQFFGGILFISPSATFDFGTLPRYTIRLTSAQPMLQRTALRDQRRNLLMRQELVTGSFSPLSASLSLSLSYAFGSFSLSPAAHLVFPLNTPSYVLEIQPSPISMPRTFSAVSEPKNEIFYFSVTLSVTL